MRNAHAKSVTRIFALLPEQGAWNEDADSGVTLWVDERRVVMQVGVFVRCHAGFETRLIGAASRTSLF
jgi:hypothetical protein